MLLNVFYPKSKVKVLGLIALFVVAGFGQTYAQKKTSAKKPEPVRDQFPIAIMWDEAVAIAKTSGRPALIFNVDYVDSVSIAFRDKILRNLEVQSYLNNTFELGVNDFSVDPPPSVGMDSLRNLGLRLDALEKGYKIPLRPTAIIIKGDGKEVDRIVHPERMSPEEFITTLKDYLAGRNTLAQYREKFWRGASSDSLHLLYLNKLADHEQMDSMLWHLSELSRTAKNPLLRREAAKQHAYIQFQTSGSPSYVDQWIATLDPKQDSLEIYDALSNLLEYHERTKKVDSIAAAYERIFTFTGDRDPDLLNNYAWDLTNFSKRFDTAMTLINEAIGKNASNPNYYDTRALIWFFREDLDSAAADSRKAYSVAVTNEDKDYYRQRMEFYEKEAKDKREYFANPDNKK
jgi:hypothetical protein